MTSIPWDRVVAASWGAGQREFLRLVQLLRTVTYMRSQVGAAAVCPPPFFVFFYLGLNAHRRCPAPPSHHTVSDNIT